MQHTEKRFVFFGDSICVGQGVSIHKGWVPRIAASITDAIGDDADLVVVNASVNGNTTRQALERMPYDVQSHGVDILLVQFGMNDCNYWATDNGGPRVSRRAFEANLEEIIQRGRRFGASKVFLNTNHPTSRTTEVMKPTQLTYQQSNAEYNEAIRAVAERLGDIHLFDVEKHFWEVIETRQLKVEDCLLSDGLHLSELGHDIYYELLSAPLMAAVEQQIKA